MHSWIRYIDNGKWFIFILMFKLDKTQPYICQYDNDNPFGHHPIDKTKTLISFNSMQLMLGGQSHS